MDGLFRRSAAAFVVLALAAAPASAQLEANLSTLLGENAEGYLKPFPTALSASLNSGIFRTGNVPQTGFNFALEVKAVVADFDDDTKVFDTAATPGFPSIEAPTVIGDPAGATQTGPGGATIGFPGGFDIKRFGFAVPQVSIGSVMGTRAIVRYISLDLGDADLGDFELFGIGAQHSVSQYFPGLPVDVAAGVMYQSFKIAEKTLDAKALAFNVTGSKQFGTVVSFEPYLGIGYDSLKLDVEYDNTSLSETINLDFDRQNDMHFALGAGVNFPVVRLHAEYTIAAESGFAGGVSFGF